MGTKTDSQVIVNGKGLIRILEYLEYEDQWRGKLKDLGVDIDWGYNSPDLYDALLDLLGFPKDEGDDPEGFSRDYLHLPDRDFRSAEEHLEWLFQEKRELQNPN